MSERHLIAVIMDVDEHQRDDIYDAAVALAEIAENGRSVPDDERPGLVAQIDWPKRKQLLNVIKKVLGLEGE